MGKRLHFISGLPRSGSTLLAAVLRQNLNACAGISSPVAEIFSTVLQTMSSSDLASQISDGQRLEILRSVVLGYYRSADHRLVFDTSRSWCGKLPALVQLFPDTRVICCVRTPAWIVDSVERLVQRNPLRAPRMFGYDVHGTVFSRAQAMAGKGVFLQAALQGLRQAWFGEFADRLIVVRYESFVDSPERVVRALYEALGEPYFDHDFDNVQFDAADFDEAWLPGLHAVRGPIRARPRRSILPPEVFGQLSECFWDDPQQNPMGVTIL